MVQLASLHRPARPLIRLAGLVTADLFAFPAAWVVAVVLATWFDRAELVLAWPPAHVVGVLFSAGAIIAMAYFALNGHYNRRAAYWEEVRLIWRGLAVIALLNFSLGFFVQVSYNRTLVVLAWLAALVLVPLGRLVAREVLAAAGNWRLPVLLVGSGDNATEAGIAIRQERHLGLEVARRVAIDEPGIEDVAASLSCTTIIIAPEPAEQDRVAALVSHLHTERFEVFIVPPLTGLPVQGVQAQYFLSRDAVFLRLRQNLFERRSLILKRTFDILASLALLLLLSPVMAWAALVIALEDGLPVIYRQARVGRGGRDFSFIKFRSMVRDADAVLAGWARDNPDLYAKFQENFKLADDPRVLRCGRFLRRTSIDELPQLWNVLRGDMSLVGPRPFPRRELERFPPDAIELYKQVKPGITGLWQVSGRSDASFEQRLALNNWYVRNWSLWIDFVILLKTVRVVLSGRGAT